MFTSSNRTECIVSQNIRHLKLVFVSVNSKQKIGGVSFLNFVWCDGNGFLLPELNNFARDGRFSSFVPRAQNKGSTTDRINLNL